MPYFEVPLTADQQTMATALAGVTYKFRVTWDHIYAYWLIDIATDEGEPILSGIPLVTGGDLLGQFDYMGLGFGLAMGGEEPTVDNLGITSKLYARI